MNTGMETIASKLLTVPDGQLQRNFEAIVDQFDRVYTQPLFENGVYYARNFKTLQACVDAVGDAGGGTVIADRGTYNERIVLDQNNVTLQGQGTDVTFISEIIETGTVITITGAHCSVKDLTIETTSGGGHLYDGILFMGVNGSAIRVYVHQSDNHAFTLGSTALNTRLLDCFIGLVDGAFVQAGVGSTHITVTNLMTTETAGAANGMFIQTVIGNISGCQTYSGTARAVRLAASSNKITVVGNQFQGAISDLGTNNYVASNNA